MKSLFQAIVIPALLVVLFSFGLIQLEHLLIGRAVILAFHIKAFAAAVLSLVALLVIVQRGKIRFGRPFEFFILAGYCAFIAADAFHKAATHQNTLPGLIYAEIFLYFFVPTLLLLLLLQWNAIGDWSPVPRQAQMRALFWAAIPIFALGFAQFVTNSPLVYVGEEGEGKVNSYILLAAGQTRAFSIFSASYEYGHFIALIGALCMAAILERDRSHSRVYLWMLFAASAAAAYTTYTRNSFLEFALGVGGVILVRVWIRRGWSGSIVIGLSYLTGLAFYAAIVGYVVSTGFRGASLLSASSLETRIIGQAGVLTKYFLHPGSMVSLLFGHGLMQGDKFAEYEKIRPLLFDNTFLDIALYSGVVGMLFYVAFVVVLYRIVLRAYSQGAGYWALALAGIFFAYPASAMLNINVSSLQVIVSLLIAYHTANSLGFARRRSALTQAESTQ